jgi:hypothetical protein
MERAIAVKKLGKLLGKHLGYRINPKAPSQEEREAAKAQMALAVEERNKLKELRDARFRAILDADQEYQSLHAAHKAAYEHVHELSSIMLTHKITVGVSNSMFFHVKAEGDSWEDVIAKLEKRA